MPFTLSNSFCWTIVPFMSPVDSLFASDLPLYSLVGYSAVGSINPTVWVISFSVFSSLAISNALASLRAWLEIEESYAWFTLSNPPIGSDPNKDSTLFIIGGMPGELENKLVPNAVSEVCIPFSTPLLEAVFIIPVRLIKLKAWRALGGTLFLKLFKIVFDKRDDKSLVNFVSIVGARVLVSSVFVTLPFTISTGLFIPTKLFGISSSCLLDSLDTLLFNVLANGRAEVLITSFKIALVAGGKFWYCLLVWNCATSVSVSCFSIDIIR